MRNPSQSSSPESGFVVASCLSNGLAITCSAPAKAADAVSHAGSQSIRRRVSKKPGAPELRYSNPLCSSRSCNFPPSSAKLWRSQMTRNFSTAFCGSGTLTRDPTLELSVRRQVEDMTEHWLSHAMVRGWLSAMFAKVGSQFQILRLGPRSPRTLTRRI